MSKPIQNYFPNTSGGVQEYINNDGDTVLNLGQEPESFDPGDASDYTLNADNSLTISDQDLADSVTVGETIVIDIMGVQTRVVVGEIDSANGTITINGDQSTLFTDISADVANTSIITLEESATFTGVADFAKGLVVVNPNGATNPLDLITVITMTVDQYEALDPLATPPGPGWDPYTLYLLSEDPITT